MEIVYLFFEFIYHLAKLVFDVGCILIAVYVMYKILRGYDVFLSMKFRKKERPW
jgi:hypothetical protein